MKTRIASDKMPLFTGLGSRLSFLGAALGLALAGLGCNEGQEGDYCNPDLSHSDCNSGLACTAASQGPPTPDNLTYYHQTLNPDLPVYGEWSPNAPCAENYCCPIAGGSTNPNCQPGCNGGAAAICMAEPSAGPDVDGGAGYVCEVAAALEAGLPIPDGAIPSDAEVEEAEAASEAEPDATTDAATEAATEAGIADASDGGR